MFNFQSREAIISKVSNVGVIGVIKAQREVFIGFYPAQLFTKEINVQFHKVWYYFEDPKSLSSIKIKIASDQ